jgi:hypothetical protein
MNLQDLSALFQLISAIEDATKELEQAYSKKDIVKFNAAKVSILNLQSQAAKIIG